MPTYLQIEGISGNVTAKGHEKWIEVYSIEFGVGRSIRDADFGRQNNRETSAALITSITVIKDMDETTPLLFTEACIGKAKTVKIDLCRTGDNIQPYMQYTLSNTLISNYRTNGSGDDSPEESLTLNFDKIEMKYTPYNDKHEPGTPVPAGYDMATAAKV